ncbi:MAG: type II toxin-antitoxin system PemK/MazF family toxin [Micropruina sp.]|uniref:type II toxin-antitoxin system PemK/MazF family toxin n=1 Tax=Micropruina sp. TaxID=2737536 RepID=UPI0039E345A0
MSLPEWGELWWCEHPDIGRRPVVILSRTAAITARRLAMIAPCTTTIRNLPSEVRLEPGEDPVPRPCVVNLDSVEQVPAGLLVQRLGRLAGDRMHAVCNALAIAVNCTNR